MENYEVIGRIGEGAHGYVLHAKNKKEDKEVALKKVLVKKLEEGIPRLILREIKTMQALECKYIMQLIEYFPQGAGVVLVFDYMPSGLWEMIHDQEINLDEPLIKSYMHMLLQGLSYMHKNHIMHRDLKPANLLINKDGILKIGDFGQARLLWLEKDKEKPYTQQVSTRWYRAPESLYGARKYSEAIDLWAAGCIFAEMFTKSPLFPAIESQAIMWRWILLTAFFGLSLAQNVTKFPDHIKLKDGCGATVKDEYACCVTAFEASVCIRLRFLRQDMGMEVLITVDDSTIIDEKISVKNPPPICATAPYLKNFLKVCIVLYDLDVNWDKKDFNGCIKFDAVFLDREFTKYKLGCFDFPLKKTEMVELKNFMLKKIHEIPHISVNLVT